ncbi:hypothetical protein ACFXG4_03690 [Nocardia sp. NPDC059246]|uniref:hypothetical protein n=1 Tax=unclassified Nocardia TaxID=2637762 RepID=UPI0036A9B4EF
MFARCCVRDGRSREKRDWRRSERQQADPREYWDDAACEPAYYFKHDAPYIPFGGWWAAYLDGELPARSA